MSVIIRSIQPDDIPACASIYNHYVRTSTFTLEEEELSFPRYEERVQSVLNGGYPFLVACGDGGMHSDSGKTVLGFAYLSEFNPRSGYRRTADLSVYVAADARGCGIGSRMLAGIEQAARECGITQLISIITGENSASLAFHKRHGFAQVGTLTDVAVKFGRILNVVYCQKAI